MFAKNYRKRSLFEKVMAKIKRCSFFAPQCISVIDDASDFKFGKHLGFAKSHHQIPPEKKVGVALAEGSSPKFEGFPSISTQWLKIAVSKLVYSSGLPRLIKKIIPRGKTGHGLRPGELPNILGFPYNISATAES